MASFINTNIGSINSQRHLSMSQAGLSTALERLSSGMRINNAKDDAAGMSIAERFTSQIKGVNQASRNANDGISMTQVAEGGLVATSDALQRIRELTVQAANATNNASDRKTIQDEVNQLLTEIDRNAQMVQFNGTNLMDGSLGTASFQVGANAYQTVTVENSNFRTNAFGNYRMGALAATATATKGDLVMGSTATNALSSATIGALNSRIATNNSFTLGGSTGSTTISYLANDSAEKVASLVNAQTSTTNVSATAITQADLSFAAVGTYAFTVASNNAVGQEKTVSMSIDNIATSDGLTSAVTAFNNITASTGITAKVNATNDGVTLTNASGEDIQISSLAAGNVNAATFGGAVIAAGGASTAWATGQVILDSSKPFGVTGANIGDFFTAATASSSLQQVNMIDVTNVDSATRSLSLVDGALNAINAQRGLYGALQSRFNNAIANLHTASENMSASRSRIQDTDFAVETANLTRGQILQQAGTAMLAQANTLPNGVLTLLRG